jgi:hypothetical protein
MERMAKDGQIHPLLRERVNLPRMTIEDIGLKMA